MEDVVKQLKKLNVKRVFVQFPEGLTLRIQEIAKSLEREGFQLIICVEKCFGACDVRDVEALRLGCEAILHIGHIPFLRKTKLPVVYWEYQLNVNPIPILEENFQKLANYQKIGLLTSTQFVQTIPEVKRFLEMRGKEVFVHTSLKYPGQILGCDLEAGIAIAERVDCFLCITAGKFYGFGIALKVDKPVLSLDLERRVIYSLEEEKRKIQKLIEWNKAQLKEARKVGIVVSWKKGQLYGDPFKVKSELEGDGKEVYILAMDEITPEKLEGLKLDALINFACPRIGRDDINRFKLPIVNFEDVGEV